MFCWGVEDRRLLACQVCLSPNSPCICINKGGCIIGVIPQKSSLFTVNLIIYAKLLQDPL